MPETVRYNFTDDRRRRRRESGQGAVMDWARILAYVTGTVDQELLAPRRELHRRRPRPRKRPLDFRTFPSAITAARDFLL